MNTKQWAVFFVALLSFDYAAATFFGGYKDVSKSYDNDGAGYYGWSEGCRCNNRLTKSLDGALESIRSRLGRYNEGFPLKDHALEEYEFNDGKLQGFHKFERKSPYRCSLSHRYARVIFNVGFFELLINYSVSVVEDILNTFLGGVGSVIGKFFRDASNFLFRIALPDVYVTVVLNQRFDAGQGFEIEGLYLNNIQQISFLNKGFSKRGDTFAPYIRPVCDHVLRNVFQDKFSVIFHRYFNKVTADRNMFYYKTTSGKKYGNYNGGKYSYKTDVDGDEDEEYYSYTYEEE